MPELPEVEIMTRALDGWSRGRRLAALVELDERCLERRIDLDPVGLTVRGAARRAKLCMLDLGEADRSVAVLVLHFRMTGKLVALPTGEPLRPGTRLVLELDGPGPGAVTFVDQRRLGQAWLLSPQALPDFLAERRLGPEPWPEHHDAAWWRQRLEGLRGPIKPALLKQDRVAGLGNICANEALWRAGIDPRTPVPQLSQAQLSALAEAVPAFIDHVIATEGAEHAAQGEIFYVNQGGPNPFDVYGRQGEACHRCGDTVQRIVQSGRGTWWCPGCQT